MAETRSKAAMKRKISTSSFISNLTTKIKKSKICNVDISVPNLDSNNKPSTSQQISCRPNIGKAQSQPIQSTLLQYNFITDADEDNIEDPICFDSSIDYIFDYDEPETKQKEENYSFTKEINDETNVLEGSSDSKCQYITPSKKPSLLQNSSTEGNDAEDDSTADSVINPAFCKTITDEVAMDKHMSTCSDKGVLNASSHETSFLGTLTTEMSSDSGNNNLNKQVDSVTVNLNSESPMAKIYHKTFGGISKVLEEMKNINNLVKKIQEELEKCTK